MFKTYEEIKQWRQETLETAAEDHFQLNVFHDQLIEHTVGMAQAKIESEQGKPPAPFAFFLMGSAGRFEQSVWSDQDHGIIFDGHSSYQEYFLKLGTEISRGLAIVGYEKCEGNVMASNPLWCQSIDLFKEQISAWLEEASWQSLRHFSIFFDSRVLLGEADFLLQVKKQAFSRLENNSDLYARLIDNVNFIKKGVGVFGQLLPEQRGEMEGNLHLKQTAYFPYVNALRILALHREMSSPSTLSRFRQLSSTYPAIASFEKDFRKLLAYRLHFRKEATSYEKGHLIPLNRLSKQEKQELKDLIKRGHKLFSKAKSIIKEEGLL